MSSRPSKPRPGAKRASAPSQARAGGDKQKRSQTQARTSKVIRKSGVPHLADALEEALRGGRTDDLIKDSLTHPLHSYPARMHPATARALVELCFETEHVQPRVVLDPFCGSGTTLVEGRAAGLDVIGSDLNPLAVRIASAKVWKADLSRLDVFRKLGHELASLGFEEGKAARRADYEPKPLRVLVGVDMAARDLEVQPWFAPHVRRELEFLAGNIDEVREKDAELADLLSVCLSSLLIKCSKRTSDTSSKLVDRKIARGMPARWFAERIDLMCQGLIDLHKAGGIGEVLVLEEDARKLAQTGLEAESVGAIISSPPYVGTYDYVDHHRLRLAFLGLPYQKFESGEIGARRRFKGRAAQATEAAYADFRACIDSFDKLLVPGGLMALMVGDSVAGVEPVWADELLRDIVGSRFKFLASASQERDKLGGLEKRAFEDRPKREHILLFEKRPV